MTSYLVSRLLQSVVVLIGVSLIVFFSLFLTGDPAPLMLSPDASRDEIAAFRRAMGFDDPILVQYARFLGGALRGDLGSSLRFQEPALRLVLDRLPATALLAVTALAWSTLAGGLAGIVGAWRQGTWLDFGVRLLALSGQAIPVFWLGLLLILLFSLWLGWLPTSGYGTWDRLVLPAVSLGAYYMSAVTRLVRASLIDALTEDYIRTARSKGLPEWRVVLKHGLRNALIPAVTVQGLHFAALLGGALITETIFAWPGIGRLAVQAIYNRDFPLVQAVVLFSGFVFVVVNAVVDLIYVVLNPRIRL
jgi:ABC-type dipeptide/oligopeptide/nickel transport system permease component